MAQPPDRDHRGTPCYIDRAGNAISCAERDRLFADATYSRVALDLVPVGDYEVRVSTIWLGVNTTASADHPPIYETLIEGGHLGNLELRWSTESDAQSGHEMMVDIVGKADEFLGPWTPPEDDDLDPDPFDVPGPPVA